MGKQAVVLIHGIGEQKPMGSLRGFVDAVWNRHDAIHHEHARFGTWSKPDNVSPTFELRRLTTSQNAAGTRTDFFEFYWAHLMEGTSYGHVLAWARALLLRRPSKVPTHLRAIYWWLLGAAGLALSLAALAAYGYLTAGWAPPTWLALAGSVIVAPTAGFVMLKIVGDAARNLHVAPANIQRRHEIRAAGVALLEELHNATRKYDRIVIVGHSLGSVIGYDMLTHAWPRFHRGHAPGSTSMHALDALEALSCDPNASTAQIQSAQRQYFDELVANGCKWRVTDFVTLGSPLAHAALLLAEDAADLRAKQEEREFPCCPPTLEQVQRNNLLRHRFSYELRGGGGAGYRIPNHAAVFAPTRWTNLFFPRRAIFWGDFVGGPLGDVMGRGIRDVPVRSSQRYGFFQHTLYWSQPSGATTPQHIDALRQALDL